MLQKIIFCVNNYKQYSSNKSKEFLHFAGEDFRKENFRKMNITTKANWQCSNCQCKKIFNSPDILPNTKLTDITDD